MIKSTQRRFEALDYSKTKKIKLTTKQYFVYAYLMSLSWWNAKDKEDHYYVYKNQFKIKDACEFLNISQPTWRSAIKKLKEEWIIEEEEKYFKIFFPTTYAPLDIKVIKLLLPYGSKLCSRGGGNIISVYSLIYRYWLACSETGESCEITINQLKKIFLTRRTKEDTITYKMMLSIFKELGLLDFITVKRDFNKIQYQAYLIKNVALTTDYEEELDLNSPDSVDHILQKIQSESIVDIEIED